MTVRSWIRPLFARTPRRAPEGSRKAPGGPPPTLSARVVGLAGRGKFRPAAPREKSWPLPAAALAPQCRSETNGRRKTKRSFSRQTSADQKNRNERKSPMSQSTLNTNDSDNHTTERGVPVTRIRIDDLPVAENLTPEQEELIQGAGLKSFRPSVEALE